MTDDPPDEIEVAYAWQSPLLPRILTIVAIVYFSAVGLDAIGSTLQTRLLPNVLTYFTQVAGLFPSAAVAVIDYRVEGWDCKASLWKEIDPRVDFPMDADSKENRFYRAMQFFRQRRPVMIALEEFLVDRHNARVQRAAQEVGVIGGIRTQSIRIPLPQPGNKVTPYERRPVASYPTEEHHYWYLTPLSRREERCSHPFTSSGDQG